MNTILERASKIKGALIVSVMTELADIASAYLDSLERDTLDRLVVEFLDSLLYSELYFAPKNCVTARLSNEILLGEGQKKQLAHRVETITFRTLGKSCRAFSTILKARLGIKPRGSIILHLTTKISEFAARLNHKWNLRYKNGMSTVVDAMQDRYLKAVFFGILVLIEPLILHFSERMRWQFALEPSLLGPIKNIYLTFADLNFVNLMVSLDGVPILRRHMNKLKSCLLAIDPGNDKILPIIDSIYDIKLAPLLYQDGMQAKLLFFLDQVSILFHELPFVYRRRLLDYLFLTLNSGIGAGIHERQIQKLTNHCFLKMFEAWTSHREEISYYLENYCDLLLNVFVSYSACCGLCRYG